MPRRKVAEMGPAISFTLWCITASIEKIWFECVLCPNCALFSSYLHYLYRSHSAYECSIGTRQYYASNMGASRRTHAEYITCTPPHTRSTQGGHGPPLWLCNKMLKPNLQSIISLTNNGCSLLSLILAKLLLFRKCFCIVCSDCQWRSHGWGRLGITTPFPIEPQMTSYIIEIVRTKCIIGEALKVRG